MKIGIVTEWFERGSAYVSVSYAKAFEIGGAEVSVYARPEHIFKGSDQWREYSPWTGRYAGYPVAKAVIRKDFEAWVSHFQPDLILFNEQQWIAPVLWARRLGIPTAAYVDYYTRKSLSSFDVYDVLFCNTQRHFDAMSWHRNAHYVPWGTDIRLFGSGGIRQECDDVTFFHSCGWSPERKGTDLVIRAFHSYREDGGLAKLVIHSQVDLGLEFPWAEEWIRSLSNLGALTVISQTVQAPGLYHLGDVYVYPSRLDGIGLTMAEALASGMILVATDDPPMREFLNAPHSKVIEVESRSARDDGYFWPMCEPSVASLVVAMKSIPTTRTELTAMRSEVRAYAREHLDWLENSRSISEICVQAVRLGVTDPEHSSLSFEAIKSGASGPLHWAFRLIGALRRAQISLRFRLPEMLSKKA